MPKYKIPMAMNMTENRVTTDVKRSVPVESADATATSSQRKRIKKVLTDEARRYMKRVKRIPNTAGFEKGGGPVE